jgi:hypothetical protein
VSGISGRLRLAVPDVAAARALAEVWSRGAGAVASWDTLPLEAAEAALRSGSVDLAFVPTLAVLRDPEAFSVVPGVALVGRAYGPARLHLPGGLAAVRPEATVSVGVDPRYQQEALLVRVLLVEHYGARPQFVPFQGEAPAGLDAVLLGPDAPAPITGFVLDLGREWFELTTRPMVWALLVATTGGVDVEEGRFLRDSTREEAGEPEVPGTEEPASVTLGAYAHAGLEEWMRYLFYQGALEEMTELPYIAFPEDEASSEDEASGDGGHHIGE